MSNPNFVDYVKIFCRSGKGGSGSAHLHRDKFTRKGGPDGGDGGRGGHVILRGNEQLWTLLHLKYQKHLFASHGEGGGASLKTGASGKDEVIEVPLGTVARDAETNEILFEVTEHGEEKILIAGGRGGLGNDHFKSATHQTPRYAQPGEPGQEGWYVLELKLLADVGLVGFPNAGKSTLLKAMSAAKPKIADYPFTTLVPNLGIVKYRDDRSFVMADIPGIIEGASEGKGLGHRFLRHIERNSMLIFMIPSDSKNIRDEYQVLLNELEKYNPELLDKPRLLVVTKTDLLDEELKEEISRELPHVRYHFISAIANIGLVSLNDIIWNILNP
jgi:GTP-binding protein